MPSRVKGPTACGARFDILKNLKKAIRKIALKTLPVYMKLHSLIKLFSTSRDIIFLLTMTCGQFILNDLI